MVAALGGLLFGYDWVVIGGAKPFYERYFGLSSAQMIGWANSCALLGCLLGSVISGALSDRIGRKKMLIAAALLFAVSSILTGWANTFAFIRDLADMRGRGHWRRFQFISYVHFGGEPRALAWPPGSCISVGHWFGGGGGPDRELAYCAGPE